jgi:hypothetical protein
LDTIDYIVRRSAPVEAAMSGDVQESVQQVRAIYTDEFGEQQLTNWRVDMDAYFAAHYRRKSIRLDSVTDEDEAVDLADLFLTENKDAIRSSRYVVGDGSVFTPGLVELPVDELEATGRIVRMEDWRSVEAGLSATDLRSWTEEQVVSVEVDYDSRRATITPGSPLSTFVMRMAEMARLKGGA